MSDQFEFRLPNGKTVRTGNIRPETRPLSFREYPESDLLSLADCVRILSNPSRRPARRRKSHTRITDQGRRSSCNAYAAVRALEKARANTGQPEIELGPEFLYAHINGGRDGGSHLDAGMKALTTIGCCTRSQIAYQAYQMRDVSIEAKRIAVNFRAFECYVLPTSSLEKLWQACITAVCRFEPIVLAVHVGPRFMKSREVAGFDRGPGNHAVHADDATFRRGNNPGSFFDILLDHAGSWDVDFGDGGRSLLVPEHLAEPSRYHAMYAIRSAVVDPDAKSPTLIA